MDFQNLLPADGSALELRWTAFGRLDPALPDTDGDGLTDWEELMVYRTALRQWDTDGDGLGDGEEVFTYGTDPLNPDSAGSGTNDFWSVVDAASLTNFPWMEGGAGLALITLETRLEAAEGLAALRVGDALVPVLPGTARTSRVAIPRGVDVPFALIAGPGTDVEDAWAAAVAASPLVIAYDDDNALHVPGGEAPAAAAGVRPLSAPSAAGVKRGLLFGVDYALSPAQGFAATNGVFTVTGAAPSETAGGDVFTWRAGHFYSRGKYTVAGLGAAHHAVGRDWERSSVFRKSGSAKRVDLWVETHFRERGKPQDAGAGRRRPERHPEESRKLLGVET